MAEPPLLPLVTIAPAMSSSTSIDLEPSLSRPADLNETAIAPVQHGAASLERPLRFASAIFSTELGNRAQRSLPEGPPFPPIIVHSNNMQGVVRTAGMWRQKYRFYCLCIFPDCGWTIGDLWDNVDIHVDTPAFCEEVLKFIAQENYRLANNYAQEWSQIHKDKLPLIGGDMRGFYDPNDHLAIVDKIFINKETKDYPRTFLWHVLHIIRTTIIMMRKKEVATTAADHVQVLPIVNRAVNDVPLLASPTGDRALLVKNDTSTQPDAAITGTPVLSSTDDPAVPVPSAPSAPPVPNKLPVASTPLSQPHPPPPRSPYSSHSNSTSSYGPRVPSGCHTEPMSHALISGRTGCSVVPPTTDQPILQVSKSRPASHHGRSGSHSHSTQPTGWTENNPRTTSGPYRQQSGSYSAAQSPRFLISNTEVGHPMIRPYHAILPFTYNHTTMPPSMPSNSSFYPGMMPQGMMPHHMHTQNPSLPHAVSHHPPGPQNSRLAYFGDMTNNLNYPANLAQQHMGTHRSMHRQDSQSHRGALYDPYNGTNPSFNASSDHYMGKKPREPSFSNLTSRPRKPSASGNRPGYNTYGGDRQANISNNGHRLMELKARAAYEDDPDIVNDLEYGCNQRWIGPKNESVNEVFVGDLPDDISESELQRLFENGVGLTPTHSCIKPNFNNPRAHACAFVAFFSTADAKKALNIRDEDRLLRGRPVSITVPKRFYQRLVEPALSGAYISSTYSSSSHGGPGGDRSARGRVHMFAHPKESIMEDLGATSGHSMYSPQDVRSDLQRMSRQQQQRDVVMNGSPEVKKSNRRQSPHVKKSTGKQAVSPKNEIIDNVQSMLDCAHGGSLSGAETGQTTASGEIQSTEPQSQTAVETSHFTATKDFSTEEPCPTATVPNGRIKGEVVVTKIATEHVRPGELPNDLSNNEHLAAKLQTFPGTDISSNKPPASVVEVLPHPIGEAVPVKQPPAEVKVDQIKIAEIKVVDVEDLQDLLTDYNHHEEAGSEDEQKHDTGFHSTHKSQSDVSGSEPNQEKPIHANNGILLTPTDVGPTIQGVLPSVATISEESNREKTPLLSTEEIQKTPTVTTTNAVTEASIKTPVMSEGKIEMMEKSTSKPVVKAILKKGGIQHTQSLHPFAKPSKTQRQKEKEQRKKDEKKKKAELAEKAKAEKASASTKLTEAVNGKSNKNQPPVPTPESSKPDVEIATTGKKKTTTKEVGKKASICTVAEESKAKDSDGDAGKHTGDTTGSPLKEIGLVTEKMEVQSVTTADPVKDGFLRTPSSTTAQFSERASASAAGNSLDSTLKPCGSQTCQMGKKAVSVVPALELYSRASPPLNKRFQVGCTAVSSTTESNQPDTVASGTTFEGVPSVIDASHCVSNTESVVRQSEGEALASPSPTTAALYTPMQIPTTQVGPGEGNSGKRKKKKKKSKKKQQQAASPDDSGSGTESMQGSYNPFTSQLLYIDAIKKATTNKEHYFNQSNADAPDRAEKAAKIEAMTEGHKKLTEPGMIGSIESYLVEKEANSSGKKLTVSDVS